MEQDKFILKGLDSLPSTDIRRDDCLYGVGDLTTRDLLNILDNLPYGLFITNKDQKIIYYNAAAEYISGVPIVEAMGKSCFEVFRSDICNSNCTINQINHNGGLMRSREFDIKRPDGNKVPVFCTTSLVPSRDGSANHIAYVFRDIADRRRLESDLRLVENRYQRIFEDSKDMIFVIDCQGMIKDANQACLDVLEYLSKPELMSLSVEQLFFNPMHWNVFRKQIDRYGSIRDFEAGFRKKCGTVIHCLMSGNAVRNDLGEIIGYEAVAKDITARMHGLQVLQRQNRKLYLLHSIAVAMNISQDLNDILAMALAKLLNVLGLKSGGIFLIDHANRNFVLRVQEGLLYKVGSDKCHVLLYDVDLMRSLLKGKVSLKPQRTFPAFKATLVGADCWRSLEVVCFLITRKEEATGFIALEIPADKKLDEDDQRILGALGNFLGSAIENSLLLQTLQQHREELQRLTACLFQTQEDERRRIARELHDEAGQALTGINFNLETIIKSIPDGLENLKDQILEIKKQINRTYQEMRRMSHRLHPAILSELGLEPALESYLSDVANYSGLDIDFRMIGFEKRLDNETETVLYRIAQEVVTNTLKHSGAEYFRLSIIKSYPRIIFLAEDDGVGFDVNTLDKRHNALGLLGIRERVAQLGGAFAIRSSHDDGTKIRIEIPVKEIASE